MSRARIALAGVVLLVAAGGLLALSPSFPLPRPGWLAFWQIHQPVAFNHNLHIEELGFECVDCHLYALTSVRASIPNIENCADCHEEAQTDSPEEAKLVKYIAAKERVPWRKIYQLPGHVYFSHRRHASIAAIGCEICHGPVSEQVKPLARPYWQPTMANCIDCHDKTNTSNDCIYCHY